MTGATIDTRAALLDAAIEVIETSGESGFRIDAVLERVGVASMAIYHHFGSRDDLVEPDHDPYAVDPHDIERKCKVMGTWVAGRKVDLKAYRAEVEQADPTHFHHLARVNHHPCC